MHTSDQRSRGLEDIESGLVEVTRQSSMVRLHHSLNARAGVDIERTPFLALAALVRQGPLSISALAESCGIEVSTMSRVADRLVSRGFAEPGDRQRDRRVVLLQATAEGRRVLDVLRVARREAMARALAGWTDEDVEAFGAYAVRFAAALNGFGQTAQPEQEEALSS